MRRTVQSQSDKDENEMSRTKETWREIVARVGGPDISEPHLDPEGKDKGMAKYACRKVLSNQDGNE
jgi:hypothetical protein